MLDLHFTDQRFFKFFNTIFVSDDFGSDHSSTIATFNIVIQNRFDFKEKNYFKKFNQVFRQEYENSVLYPPVYPKAELNQFNEVLVHIMKSQVQKSYILQKRFPFGHDTTELIREKKKKEER